MSDLNLNWVVECSGHLLRRELLPWRAPERERERVLLEGNRGFVLANVFGYFPDPYPNSVNWANPVTRKLKVRR